MKAIDELALRKYQLWTFGERFSEMFVLVLFAVFSGCALRPSYSIHSRAMENCVLQSAKQLGSQESIFKGYEYEMYSQTGHYFGQLQLEVLGDRATLVGFSLLGNKEFVVEASSQVSSDSHPLYRGEVKPEFLLALLLFTELKKPALEQLSQQCTFTQSENRFSKEHKERVFSQEGSRLIELSAVNDQGQRLVFWYGFSPTFFLSLIEIS